MSYEEYVTKCQKIISFGLETPKFKSEIVKSMLDKSVPFKNFTEKQKFAIDNIILKWRISLNPKVLPKSK